MILVCIEGKTKFGNWPTLGSKTCERLGIGEEKELWGENRAFDTEIVRGIRHGSSIQPEVAGKLKKAFF